LNVNQSGCSARTGRARVVDDGEGGRGLTVKFRGGGVLALRAENHRQVA
jgi:hypothetical protein